MSSAFKLAGSGFANTILQTVSDPLAGLILGMLATSLVQSSSSTTSIVVGLVAAGTLDLQLAIPMQDGTAHDLDHLGEREEKQDKGEDHQRQRIRDQS
ncbi:hypothetical protein ACFL3H_07830 [Gemmatimonadota bacterium]